MRFHVDQNLPSENANGSYSPAKEMIYYGVSFEPPLALLHKNSADFRQRSLPSIISE
jgi:hypothetical protein